MIKEPFSGKSEYPQTARSYTGSPKVSVLKRSRMMLASDVNLQGVEQRKYLPPSSTRIKSLAPVVADLQHTLKGIQDKNRMKHSMFWVYELLAS